MLFRRTRLLTWIRTQNLGGSGRQLGTTMGPLGSVTAPGPMTDRARGSVAARPLSAAGYVCRSASRNLSLGNAGGGAGPREAFRDITSQRPEPEQLQAVTFAGVYLDKC